MWRAQRVTTAKRERWALGQKSTHGLRILGCLALLTGSAFGLPQQYMQEGLLVGAGGQPLVGRHRLTIRLYANEAGGAPLFEEIHNDVELFEGYYAVAVGSVRALDGALFGRDTLYLGLAVDAGAELAPRTPFKKVPAAFWADTALNVVGDITPRTVRVGGGVVIDQNGRWVGDPTGLVGPPGPQGVAGPVGPQGPAGVAGGNGSPDTPAQVLGKLVQVDGAGTGLDADLLDGLQADRFMRTDIDTGSVGRISAGDGLRVSAAGREIANIIGGAVGDAGRQLRLEAQDDVQEGGHLHLDGAANDQDWAIDTYQGNLRIFEPAPSNGQARRDGSLLIFRPGGEVNVNVSGNLTVGALNASALTIAGRTIIGADGTLNQAQWDLAAQVRVLTNTVGNPDRNMYINYPIRADSKTFLYNNPQVEGHLTVNGNVSLGGGFIHDVGVTYTCESGGGALGNCPNSGFWTFDKIVLEHNHADVQARMDATPLGSMNVEGQVLVDGDIRTNSNLRLGNNLYLGGNTIYDVGVTYTCEAGAAALGACPNAGAWTFNKLAITNTQAEVPARLAAIPNGSLNLQGQLRADGQILSLNNIVATGQLQAGQSVLATGVLQLGAGAGERLTAAQLATLVGGGNADALHTHAGLGGRKPWRQIGNLNDFFNLRAQYPFTDYEFGVTYNTFSILPVVFSNWNGGWRVTGQYSYIVGDRFPWEGGNSFTHGGSIWTWDTQGAADNACNTAGSWFQYYFLHYGNPNPHNGHGDTYFWGSNACSVPNLYVREL